MDHRPGVFIGLIPGHARTGWYEEVSGVIDAQPIDGFEIVRARGSDSDDEKTIVGGRSGEFIYGRPTNGTHSPTSTSSAR